MYDITTIFPFLHAKRLPISRDQFFLFFVAINQFFLSLDTYLVHVLNGTIRLREWIPILFGATAGISLLIAGIIAIRRRNLANSLATLVFVASMIVGILGAYFHFIRGTLPFAPAGEQITLKLLIWAPPILAPFAFAGVGLLGMSAAWVEDPVDSGILQLPFGLRIHMPYSKTAAYLLLVSLGIVVALVSSVLDHARHEWDNPALWLPVVIGVFSVIVSAGLAFVQHPTKTDMLTHIVAMLLLIVVGVIGAYFHIQTDLTTKNTIVVERFLRGAPFLSPLLFANMGILGLVALLPATNEKQSLSTSI